MPDHKCCTSGEQFDAAMKCETREEAEEWLEGETRHLVDYHEKSVPEAIEIIKSNLGYMAGYYEHETAQKVHRLFNAVHPVFKSANYHRTVTSEQAFKIGLEAGKKSHG